MKQKTALVIGGGIAGLASALELARQGVSTTVIEAKDRFGGRIHTIYEGAVPIELGAEFIHGRSEALLKAIEQANLSTQPVAGKGQLFENGKFGKSNLWDTVAKVFNQIDIRKRDCSFDEFLAEKKIKEPARTFARNFVMGFDAANPDLASAHALRRAEYASEHMSGDKAMRVTRGYSALVEQFVKQIESHGGRLILSTRARRIEWKKGEVEVFTNRKSLRANIAIVALPLGILKTRDVKFSPSLPDKIEAVNGLEFGNVVRIIFHFKESSWKDFGFIQAFDEAIPTWWSDPRGPILVGWAGGPRADALLKFSKGKLETTGLEILRKIIFGGATVDALRKRLHAVHYFNWARDRDIRGGYSYIPVNGLDLPKLLAAPVAETLFFAGEATVADAQMGTVFGALESGLRATKEALGTGSFLHGSPDAKCILHSLG